MQSNPRVGLVRYCTLSLALLMKSCQVFPHNLFYTHHFLSIPLGSL